MAIARINNVELYYEVHGEGDWLIFVHGGDGTHLSWWKQAYFFRDYYKCLLYDMQGLGQSDGVVNYEASWRDLLALMDHLGIESAHLNGWSGGGWTVASLTQRHPGRARSLIMTDAPFGFQTPALSEWSQEMLEELDRGLSTRDDTGAGTFASLHPKEYFLSGLLERLNEDTRPPTRERALQKYGDAYRQWRDAAPGDYSDFPVPALFIVGESDDLTGPSLIRGTAERVRGAKLAVIPRSGHRPPWEQAEIYNMLLLEFLQTVDLTRRNPAYAPPRGSLVEFFHNLSGLASQVGTRDLEMHHERE